MFLLRRLSLALSLMIGAIFSQLPEYAQQYRQRLGGAIDELNGIVAQFDGEIASENLDRAQALQRLSENTDTLARQRGTAMRETIARAARLSEQQKQFADSGNFGRIAVMTRNFDPGVAKNAYAAFEPALPVTIEGGTAALIGFLGGGAALRLLSWPVRRRLGAKKAPPRTV